MRDFKPQPFPLLVSVCMQPEPGRKHEWITRPRARDPDLPTQYKVSKMCLLEGDR